jgi:hypothetical protein
MLHKPETIYWLVTQFEPNGVCVYETSAKGCKNRVYVHTKDAVNMTGNKNFDRKHSTFITADESQTAEREKSVISFTIVTT